MDVGYLKPENTRAPSRANNDENVIGHTHYLNWQQDKFLENCVCKFKEKNIKRYWSYWL